MGIAIALVIMAIQLISGEATFAQAFLSGIGFLYIWYWIFTGLAFLFGGLFGLGLTSFLTILGLSEDKFFGLLGFAGGGILSIWMFIRFIIFRALLLIGIKLMIISGQGATTFQDFNQNYFLIGIIMFLFYLFVKRRTKNNSKNSSK